MAEDLGKKLKAIRESREISLEEISQKTRIRLAHLEAIEWGNANALSSTAQYRGFLRLYAAELGVNLSELEDDGTVDEQPISLEAELQEEEYKSQSDDKNNQEEVLEDIATRKETPSHEVAEEEIPPSNLISHEVNLEEGYLSSKPSPKFLSIGEKIQKRRELLSLSLKDIENHTHIRLPYLIAIESGNFDQLPSPVQAKGMLANYAAFLNFDTEEILMEYAQGLQEKHSITLQSAPTKKKTQVKEISPGRLKLKNFFSIDLLMILILFIAFAAFIIWGINQILRSDEPVIQSTDIPEISDILLATGTTSAQPSGSPESTTSDSEEEPTPAETLPLFTPRPNENPINVVIIPRQNVWVQVTADSEVIFSGRLLTGNAYDYTAEEILEILTGNAGALQIYFNDLDIGSPGLIGQVVDLIFTEDGQVLPTPTNTPTITNTPQDTVTPTITPSPTLTPTPTPTSPF